MKELWRTMKAKWECYFIRSITNNADNYDGKYMKIQYNLGDNLALKKTLKFRNMIIAFESVFSWRQQILSAGFFRWICINYKCYSMIRLTDVIDTRTDVPKGIAVNKTNSSRECIMCQHRYFFEVNCRF